MVRICLRHIVNRELEVAGYFLTETLKKGVSFLGPSEEIAVTAVELTVR